MIKEFMAAINNSVNNYSEIDFTVGTEGSTYINIKFIPEQVITQGNIMTIYSGDNHFSFPIDDITYDEIEDGYCVCDGDTFIFIAA